MQAFQYISLPSLADTLLSLGAAFVLGGLIGLERQYRQRTAGLRTNVLVCVGAALFVDIAVRFYDLHGGGTTPLHVIAYVVSGVGFLGAGVIMREEGNVRGINTAATLWGSAAVGSAAGADLLIEAVLGTFFIVAANTMLRPIVTAINRQPLDQAAVEATFSLHVVADRERRKEALALVEQSAEQAGYPVRDLRVRPFGDDEVEIEAELASESVDDEVLDRVVAGWQQTGFVRQAFWSASTRE